MLADPNVVMGLADAGAHVGQIMDASQPTFFLTNWVRERGVFPIEEGVRRLTSDTANLFGITDRGVLREGVVRRRQRDRPRPPAPSSCPSTCTTSPAAPAATSSGPQGYRATVVNGRVSLEDGRHTGDLAGATLRSGQLARPSVPRLAAQQSRTTPNLRMFLGPRPRISLRKFGGWRSGQ